MGILLDALACSLKLLSSLVKSTQCFMYLVECEVFGITHALREHSHLVEQVVLRSNGLLVYR